MATGTKLMKEISDQFLVCKICFEAYKNPKTLICLHTFCADCLQKHNDSESERTSRFAIYTSRYISCPLCRRKTEIPTGGIKRLPDNFLVSNLNEAVNRRRINRVPPCEICQSVRPRSNDACSKCLDCSKLLCKLCVDLHVNTKVTQDHNLIDIEGEKDIECKNHPEELVRYYCEPCDECICVVCTFQEHREHEICSFNDGFAKYKVMLDDLLAQCKERLDVVQSKLSVINKCETIAKDARQRIRDMSINYISRVRSTEKKLLQQVDDTFGEKVLSFLDDKQWLQENYDSLQNTCNLAEIIMKDKGVEMLLLKKEMQGKLSMLLERNIPSIPNEFSKQVKFIPGEVELGTLLISDNDMENGVELHEIQCKGHNKNTQTMSICRSRDSSTTMACNMRTKFVSTELQTVGVVTSDKECGTERKETRDKGVLVYSMDSKTKSVMTDIVELKSTKVQTARVSSVERETMTPNRSVSVSSCNGINNQTSEVPNGTCSVQSYSRSRTRRQTSLEGTSSSYSTRTVSTMTFPTHSGQNSPPVRRVRKRDRGVNTSPTRTRDRGNVTPFPVKIIPDCTDTHTNTNRVFLRHCATLAVASSSTTDTQTPISRFCDRAIITDFTGSVSKSTSTALVACVDSETTMPLITFEDAHTLTEEKCTSERATCTVSIETTTRATGTAPRLTDNKGVSVVPKRRTVETNTLPIELKNVSKEQISRERGTSPLPSKLMDRATSVIRDIKIDVSDMMIQTDNVDAETTMSKSVTMTDSLTDIPRTTMLSKEILTTVPMIDDWTLTDSPQYINTGVSPARPMTLDTGVETDRVVYMDQATYTPVVIMRDDETETVVMVADNETLTERIVQCDAQTSVVIPMEERETSTDITPSCDRETETDDTLANYNKKPCSHIHTQTHMKTSNKKLNTHLPKCYDKAVNTDYDFVESLFREGNFRPISSKACQTNERATMAISCAPVVELQRDFQTQTFDVKVFDKSVETSQEELKSLIRTRERSTSTEHMHYIGLFSDMDVDELYLVPDGAIDIVENEIHMVDEETSTDETTYVETAVQVSWLPFLTEINALNELKNCTSTATNTLSKLTFEKETSTPIKHFITKGTMTFFQSKSDKATCTFTHARYLADTKFGGAVPAEKGPERIRRKDKHTMTMFVELKHVGVSTDNSLLDEKMVACISKLKSVSEKLNSPTGRQVSFNDSFTDSQTTNKLSDERPQSPMKAEERRKQQISHLVEKSNSILKTSKHSDVTQPHRKAQPLTTLKGKAVGNKVEEEHSRSKSLPRQLATGGVRMGNSAPKSPSKLPLLRYNSAPGRIATGQKPNASPKLGQPSKIPISHKQGEGTIEHSPTPPSKHAVPSLPAITETGTPSTCSDDSLSSYASAASSTSFSISDAASSETTGDRSSYRLSTHSSASAPGTISEQEAATSGKKMGFMQRLLSKKRKDSSDSDKNLSKSKEKDVQSDKNDRIGDATPKLREKQKPKPTMPSPKLPVESPKQPPQPSPRPQKKTTAFDYMKQRIFSIQDDDDDKKKPATKTATKSKSGKPPKPDKKPKKSK